MSKDLVFDWALLPGGWAANVRITIAAGRIQAVAPDADPVGAERITGAATPGMPNLHSHGFQRGMAGMSETRGPSADSFWTWRAVMYRFLAQLTPEDVEAITAYAYMRMLEAGFCAVAEFHYLHHDPAGQPYDDQGEMSGRIAAAAAESGIGLTLLPVFYANGGFGGAAPSESQRRFVNDPDRFLALLQRSRTLVRAAPDASVGLGFHSLRAVTPDAMAAVQAGAGADAGPIHIHAAEQEQEVADCLAATGARPIEWLLDDAGLDRRWCVVHATHMTPDETGRLARSGAVAGLCPTTEANLGDGLFPAEQFLAAGGAFGIGSDSNIETDPAADLRLLEYGRRLQDRRRNVLAADAGGSTARTLVEAALAGGAQACGRNSGALAPGRSADIVVLDSDHPDLAGLNPGQWLDGWVFVAGPAAVRTVLVAGRPWVIDGQHVDRDRIVARYRTAMQRLKETG